MKIISQKFSIIAGLRQENAIHRVFYQQ